MGENAAWTEVSFPSGPVLLGVTPAHSSSKMANRMSMYSVASDNMPGGSRGTGQQSAQVSTTTLLNSVHNIYVEGHAYHLDAGSR